MVVVVAVLGGLAQGGSRLLEEDFGNGNLAINNCESGTGTHGDSCCCLVE